MSIFSRSHLATLSPYFSRSHLANPRKSPTLQLSPCRSRFSPALSVCRRCLVSRLPAAVAARVLPEVSGRRPRRGDGGGSCPAGGANFHTRCSPTPTWRGGGGAQNGEAGMKTVSRRRARSLSAVLVIGFSESIQLITAMQPFSNKTSCI